MIKLRISVQVVYRGEKALPSSIEILNKNQFLMEGSRKVQSVPVKAEVVTLLNGR